MTYHDGKPVTDGSVRLEVSGTRFYYRGSRSLLEKTYPVKSGLISVVIEDMPHDTEKLHFKVKWKPRPSNDIVSINTVKLHIETDKVYYH